MTCGWLRSGFRWCGPVAAATLLSFCTPARAVDRAPSIGGDVAVLLQAAVVPAACERTTAVVLPTKVRPIPRAAAAAPPPAIVKILRRGGHGRDARECRWPLASADMASALPGFGPRATQAALVANAADIARLCRRLL